MSDSDEIPQERWDVFAARWLRERLGYILLIIYMLLLCLAIPFSVNELVKRHAEVSNYTVCTVYLYTYILYSTMYMPWTGGFPQNF